jgi:tetratricopeptide (TPR) repeat protein
MGLWDRVTSQTGRNAYYDKAIRLYDQGQYEEAIPLFKQALEETRGGPLAGRLARFYLAESYGALALSQMNKAANERAIENLKEAVALKPTYADLHYHLGKAYLENNQPVEAQTALEKSLAINPRYARANLLYGITYSILGDPAKGLTYARHACNISGELEISLFRAAEEADQQGEPETAIRLLKAMNEPRTEDSLHHASQAREAYQRKDWDTAIREMQQAVALKPHYADLQNILGIYFYEASRFAEAAVAFARAIQINPQYVEAYLHHALSLEALGQTEAAQKAYGAVLVIDPENQVAQDALHKTKNA